MCLLLAALGCIAASARAGAQNPPAAGSLAGPGVVTRRIVLKDAASAELLRVKLEQMKGSGLFRDLIPNVDPKNPTAHIQITFLASGNYLLMVGDPRWVDMNLNSVRLMSYMFDRPSAHLQLSMRVVQITGPANAEVIQTSETVQQLVDAQREEVVRSFTDLDEYLVGRIRVRMGQDRRIYDAVQELFPTLGTGQRPLTIPEILILLALDRSAPAPAGDAAGAGNEAEAALRGLQQTLERGLRTPGKSEAALVEEVRQALGPWKASVQSGQAWLQQSADALKKDKTSLGALKQALTHPDVPVPHWLTRRIARSMALTERLYPNLRQKHMESALRELERRYSSALERVKTIETAMSKGEEPNAEPRKGAEKDDTSATLVMLPGRTSRALLGLKAVADELIPSPMALFDAVATTVETSAPSPEQLIQMFRQYTAERRRLDQMLEAETQSDFIVNYDRLHALESALNLWLRRAAEAMSRSLGAQFYSRYVNEIRILANQRLGQSSNRELLGTASIDAVADVARDLLLSDNGVNVFLSNSISLQFANGATNSVSAQVQSSLPSRSTILERLQQANQANSLVSGLAQQYGINGEGIIKSLLAGGQAVPVQGGITLSATPTIGFDASTVQLNLTANQTLAPGNEKVVDRVTNHSINNATVSAISYEPMVLSTLASNLSYFEDSGGIPVLRKVPGLKDLLKDIPLPGFKQGKRQKGVYQSSVIILEPVVIPTIEDLVRYHAGWTKPEPVVEAAASAAVPAAPAAVDPATGEPVVTIIVPAAPAPAAPAPAAPAAPAPGPAAPAPATKP